MNPPVQRSADLFDLFDEVRRGGFNVGAEQYLATHKLLAALAARDELPHHSQRLVGLLAPILCTTPEEQVAFPSYYEKWLRLNPALFSYQPSPARPPADDQPQDEDARGDGQRTHPPLKWLALIVPAALALTLLAFLLWYLSSPTPITLRGRVLEKGQPVFRARVTLLRQDSTQDEVTFTDSDGAFTFNYTDKDLPVSLRAESEDASKVGGFSINNSTTTDVQLVLNDRVAIGQPASASRFEALLNFVRRYPGLFGAGPAAVLLGLALSLYRRYGRRPLALRKWRTRKKVKTEHLVVKGASEKLTRLLSLRRAAQELRRHRPLNAHDLDVNRTVEETVRRGLFTPTYTNRKSSPEYLVLIDRANFSDQQARLATEVIRHLGKNSVFIDNYYFQGDPRICRKDGPKPQNWTLKELAAKHPEHYLLIFTHMAGMFNPLTGRPQPWIESFSPWAMRAVLTSEAEPGGYREWVLKAAGFIVAPADKVGIGLVGEAIHTGAIGRRRDRDQIKPLPEMLLWRPGRWVEEAPPSPSALKELRQQLKSFLGDEGYFWLSACAVYPMLYWDITLYLGHHLISQDRFEEKFSALVRLPWFRHGSMPDWLREFLIGGLSKDEERSIRRALESLLLSSLTKRDGFILPIARLPNSERSTFLGRVRTRLVNKVSDWKRRRRLLSLLEAEPAYALPQDYVLLSFLSGHQVPRLALLVPDELEDAFFTEQSFWDLLLVKAMPLFTIGFAVALPTFLAVAMKDLLMFPLTLFFTAPWAAFLAYPLLRTRDWLPEENEPDERQAATESVGGSPKRRGLSEPRLASEWPVVLGRPLLDNEPLHGREEMLSQVIKHLRRFQPVNIVGERRMGKTSLLNHLLAHADARLTDASYRPLTVRVDLQEIGLEVRRFYGRALSEMLSKIERVQPERWGGRRASLSQQQIEPSFDDLRDFLIEIKEDAEGFHPIILIDEFETLLAAQVGQMLPEFFDRLRALISARLITIVIASTRPLSDYGERKYLFNPLTSPFFNIFTTVRLTSLTASAAMALLRQVSTSQLTEDEISEAVKWAGGHPYLLQIAANTRHEAKLYGYPEEWVYERRKRLALESGTPLPSTQRRETLSNSPDTGGEFNARPFQRAMRATSNFIENSYEGFFDPYDLESVRLTPLPTGSTLWQIFAKPAKVFASFHVKPRFFWAAVVILALSLIWQFLLEQRVGLENLTRAQIEANTDNLPPEQVQQLIQTQSGTGVRIIQRFITVVSFAIIFSVGAGIYFLGSRMLRGLTTYKQALSIYVYSSLPLTVITVLGNIVFLYLLSVEDIPSRLNYNNLFALNFGFLVDRRTSPATAAVFSSVDLLTLYGLLLAALGLRKLGKLSWARCWLIVLTLWLVGTVFRISTAVLFGT